MTRRELIGSAALLPIQAQARRPNVLLVLSDDHSYPYLGCYGYPIRTPVLDDFARKGLRCDRMFTAAPQCVPSRAAIMSGRMPVAIRMGRFSSPLPPDVVTFPELMRQAGYFTGVCRRNYHLDGPPNAANSQPVFDKYDLQTFARRMDWVDRSARRDLTAAKMNEFFDKKPAEKPFFLWVNFNDPHHVWDADAIPDPYDPKTLPLPKHFPDLPGLREDFAKYLGEITRADDEFRMVLDVLTRRGYRDNTLVIFMGDNGMALPHGKGSLYDPGLNVPFLVQWPGVVNPGRATTELLSGEDIAPSVLEAVGLPVPKAMSGHSFLNLLRGQRYEGRRYIFGQRGPHGNTPMTANTKSSNFDLSRCVRTQRWKLIYNCTPHMEYSPVDSANDPGWKQMKAAHAAGKLPIELDRAYFTLPRPVLELFDLDNDPSELSNLIGRPEHSAIQSELLRALTEKMILDYDFLPLPLAN
ncbi:MAG: sulfatase [Acidobacteria bacterium]|nr:sulfatase [Acidobacteriota bacterium]